MEASIIINDVRNMHGRRLACTKQSNPQDPIIGGALKLHFYTYLICCFHYHEHMYTILLESNQVIKSQILLV